MIAALAPLRLQPDVTALLVAPLQVRTTRTLLSVLTNPHLTDKPGGLHGAHPRQLPEQFTAIDLLDKVGTVVGRPCTWSRPT